MNAKDDKWSDGENENLVYEEFESNAFRRKEESEESQRNPGFVRRRYHFAVT